MMDDSLALSEFLSTYQSYVDSSLKPTESTIRRILQEWRQPAYWAAFDQRTSNQATRSPIHRTKTRIKRPESVIDKLYRKSPAFPDGLSGNSLKVMHDTLGARIIVYFLSDLPVVDRHLRSFNEIELSSQDPPTAYLSQDLYSGLDLNKCRRADKESGYNSIHYIARLRSVDGLPDMRSSPWFEIQVRTLAEDVWGEIEHILGYKPNKHTSLAVKNQFKVISKQLSAIDEHFDFLYNELARFQEEGRPKDSDLLNAENLPATLSEAGLSCAQGEMDGMLKVLNSRGVDTVEKFRQAATSEKLEHIRQVYRTRKGRAPSAFEMVACLAAINRASTQKEEAELIHAQILFTDYWDTYKNSDSKQM